MSSNRPQNPSPLTALSNRWTVKGVRISFAKNSDGSTIRAFTKEKQYGKGGNLLKIRRSTTGQTGTLTVPALNRLLETIISTGSRHVAYLEVLDDGRIQVSLDPSVRNGIKPVHGANGEHLVSAYERATGLLESSQDAFAARAARAQLAERFTVRS